MHVQMYETAHQTLPGVNSGARPMGDNDSGAHIILPVMMARNTDSAPPPT